MLVVLSGGGWTRTSDHLARPCGPRVQVLYQLSYAPNGETAAVMVTGRRLRWRYAFGLTANGSSSTGAVAWVAASTVRPAR